jgi:hypothetical protein
MDPYLEGAEWTSVHTELSSEIARQLAPKLRPKYIVRTTRRFLAEAPEDVTISAGDLYPDVAVCRAEQPGQAAAGAIALAPPLQMATVISQPEPQVTIEVRDVANRQWVTAIEVLSPSNKRGAGYREYIDRRSRILRSSAHMIEIDLLREGQRVPMLARLPAAPYFVFISRAEARPVLDVWPIELDGPLPVVPVPLRPPDPDVPLDLQAALTTVYDALGYDLSVDYSRPPEPPLKAEASEWAASLLRAAGHERKRST